MNTSLNTHPNIAQHAVAGNGLDTVNALERLLLAAAILGDHAAIDRFVPQFMAATGGSANMSTFDGSWVASFYRSAADGAESSALIAHVTNALGHGDADNHLAA